MSIVRHYTYLTCIQALHIYTTYTLTISARGKYTSTDSSITTYNTAYMHIGIVSIRKVSKV